MGAFWRVFRPLIFSSFLLLTTGTWQHAAAAMQLNLAWTDASNNELGFKIERRTNAVGFQQITTVGANVSTYTDASILAGTTYYYRVRAYNSAGDSAYSNEALGMATADTVSPSVSITAPGNGATVVGSAVPVSASATDNVGVVGVQFIVDGANIAGEDTSAPYAIAWNTTSVANGSHSVAAIARDAAGNQTTSTPIIVTVDNPPPPAGDSQVLFLGADALTQGTWQDSYGSDGFVLLNHSGVGQDNVNLPAYLSAYTHTGTNWVWSSGTPDVRALANPEGQRVAATAYAATSFSVTLTAADTTLHSLALYFVDWDVRSRSQTVSVYAVDTGELLDERTLVDFQAGVYLTYQVQGSVRVEITRTGGVNAVLSGLFWDDGLPTGGSQVSFVEADTQTQGNWQGLYGSDGFVLLNHSGVGQDNVSLPAYLSAYTHTGADYVWSSSTPDVRALANPEGQRVAATAYGSIFSVTLAAADTTLHSLALYFVDWDTSNRAQTVSVYAVDTGELLDERTLVDFQAGVYLTYQVQGSVRVEITRTGGVNAVLSGLFWDDGSNNSLPTHLLTVAKAGTGSGTVTSTPAGINCGSDCSEAYTANTAVTLTATPASGSTFVGWSGNTDCSDGSVTMTAAKSCTATFNLVPPTTYSLTVTKAGTGTGTVTATGINCGADCSEAYTANTAVTLTATPASGSTFAGWSGHADCSDGSVTMNAAKTCTATFNLVPPTTYSLTVTKAGTGTGTVTATGINCGADCSEAYTANTVVTLTATPASGSTFAGWSGHADCSDGSVTMNAAKTCTATFNLLPPTTYSLTVTKAGTGTGTVTATGINCGADCSEAYTANTVVTLTATPASGSIFAGWSGHADCSDGSVTMNAAKTCTATFNAQMNVRIGVFRPSTGKWYLDLNGNGVIDDCSNNGCPVFGQQGDLPLAGDWLGNGSVQLGVFNTATRQWRLDRNANDLWEGCTVDLCFGPLWSATDLPVVGRWTSANPKDSIGIYRPSKRVWRLDFNSNGLWESCTTDKCWSFGNLSGLPVVGDWTGGGTTKLGVFDPTTGQWKLDRDGNGKLDSCTVDGCVGPFGISGDRPVAGDWYGTGQAKIGVFDPVTGMWELDRNGNGTFDGCSVDTCLGPFGQSGDVPVVGKW